MELSGKTIDALCGMITGDIDEDYPYRTGPNLINFFQPIRIRRELRFPLSITNEVHGREAERTQRNRPNETGDTRGT